MSKNPPTIVSRADSAETAVAITERLKMRAAFTPTAGGAFTHGTTVQSTLIPALLSLGITTTSSSGQLIAATTAMQDQINAIDEVMNRIVYTLEANGLTS